MENQTNPKLIADYFIALSNTTGSLITNLKLQKLVYYTQSWYLAVNKQPLFEEDFQAWVHGPVLPSLYSTYREFRWQPILRNDLDDAKLAEIKSKFSSDVVEILEDIVDEYFPMDAYQLEKHTHSEKPWVDARSGLSEDSPSHEIITKESIKEFYSQFVING